MLNSEDKKNEHKSDMPVYLQRLGQTLITNFFGPMPGSDADETHDALHAGFAEFQKADFMKAAYEKNLAKRASDVRAPSSSSVE